MRSCTLKKQITWNKVMNAENVVVVGQLGVSLQLGLTLTLVLFNKTST